MNFSRALALILVLGLAGCRRTITEEEQTARREVRQTLNERAFTRALAPAERVLAFAPNDDGAWARLAQAQFGLGDLAGLRRTLRKWRGAVRRPSPKYHEYAGDLACAEGRRAEALEAWGRAVAGKERKARVFRKIARLEQGERRWDRAALAWTRAMQPHDDIEGLVNRAICYRHLHSWKAAAADLQRAGQLDSQSALVRRERARFDRLGKFLDEVRKLDQELIASPNDFEILGDRALLFLRAEDADLALDDAEKALQLAPGTVRPRLWQALAARALGRPSAPALAKTFQLAALTPEFLQTIRRLDTEIMAEPGSAELRTNRAWQLNEIGQPQLALADARAALEFDPKSAGAEAEQSYALAKLERIPEAYEAIKRATEFDPNFSTAWQYRGELEMRRGDYMAAIESLTRGLAINRTPAALARREECYRQLGLLAKAADDQKALEELNAPR